MSPPPLATRKSLFEALPAFKTQWPSRGWSWDRRFECLASTIAVSSRDEGWAAATAYFPTVWEEKNLPEAPTMVKDLAEHTGGVRSDQFLFSTANVQGVMFYGLWWPWGGDGNNISMRLGMTGNPSSDEEWDLRTMFNATDD